MQCSMALDKMKDLTLKEPMLRAQLVELEGIPLTEPIYTTWDRVWKFKARPDDLLIATYAKAGWCG